MRCSMIGLLDDQLPGHGEWAAYGGGERIMTGLRVVGADVHRRASLEV